MARVFRRRLYLVRRSNNIHVIGWAFTAPPKVQDKSPNDRKSAWVGIGYLYMRTFFSGLVVHVVQLYAREAILPLSVLLFLEIS